MTVFLKAGDKIILAVPDLHPTNSASEDVAYWSDVYGRVGVDVHHLLVSPELTHPVIVAVFRDEPVASDVLLHGAPEWAPIP